MIPVGVQGHRTTGFELPHAVNGLNYPTHTVQFYEADEVLLDALCEFFGATLVRGEIAIVLATKSHRDGLAARLTARGLDVAQAGRDGRYIALDAAETLSSIMSNGSLDASRFTDVMSGVIAHATASAKGEPPRMAIFGELVALLCADGNHEAAVGLEHLWNDLGQHHAFSLHCAYPMSAFRRGGDGEAIEEICAAHAHVTPAESFSSLTDVVERMRAITRLQQQAHALETEIAERKRMEQMLIERNEELRVAVEARDEFLSVAAHELKTPVTSLRAFAQLLLRDVRGNHAIAPERLERALGAIERQTGKVNQLVARLLDTGQIEAGKLRIEPGETDLVALVRASIEQFSVDPNHTLLYEGPERLDAVVDPVRFEQVVANLLDNAVKFSPEGGTVTVDLGYDESSDIRLRVTDHGVGIPSDRREAVFERFHQAHSNGHLSGLGLGLYITREIISLHDGLIRVEEPPHRGTRFVVTLPSSAGGVRAMPAG